MLTRCRPLCFPLALWIASPGLAAQTSVTPVAHVGSGHGPGIERAVYASDEAQNNVIELYGVPVDASAPPVRLNLPLPPGGDIALLLGSPVIAQVAGDRALYVADQLTDEVYELFSVPTDGSLPPLKLSGPLVAGGDVSDFRCTAQRAVYTADGTVDNRSELYSAPLDGSAAPIELTPGLNVYGAPQFTADGSLAVFKTTDGIREYLYVVPVDGSQPPLFLADSGPPHSLFAFTYFQTIELSSDGTHVAYVSVSLDDSTMVANDFSARLDGSTPPVRLNPSPMGSSDLVVSPDGQRVLFTGAGLQSVRMDGTGLVTLTQSGEYTGSDMFRISADSVYTVFASRGSAGSSLHLARLDGSQPLQLLAPIPDIITYVLLSPNGTDMIYLAQDAQIRRLMYGLTQPEQPVLLSGIPPANHGVRQEVGGSTIEFTPDGRVVFLGDLGLDEVYELYSVPFDGSALPRRLNPALSGERDVVNFRVCAGGRRLLYDADQSADQVFELYTVPVDGSSAPIRLNQAPVTGGDVYRYELEPAAGRHVTRP